MGRMADITLYVTDDKKLLLAQVDHDFYRMNAKDGKWIKDQNAARHWYSDSPDAEPITPQEALAIAEKWYPGRGAKLIPQGTGGNAGQ